MTDLTRRDALKLSVGAAVGAAALGAGLGPAAAQNAALKLTPEKGAKLRILRPTKFVPADETVWLENTKKYTQQTGVEVRVDFESWEDLRPKSAVAANVGKGPDVVYGWYDDAHQYPEKLVELTDVAKYLGDKYGGWFDVAQRFGIRQGKWISIPLGASGSCMVYRMSWCKEAGFEKFPETTGDFLKMAQQLKKNGHPVGFALGNAVGDANTYCNWLLWSHGGKLVNEKDEVAINSPETIAALEYSKQLYETFIPGTLSWLDPSNNKAFLDGQISATPNGISIYYAAKTATDPALKAMAEDINHARMPVGPIGRPTETALITPAMVFKYTKFPNAAKDYIRFMMEREQYEAWENASIGYFQHPLGAYDQMAVWSADPKHLPYRDTLKRALWPGYAGSMGYASAGALADYIVVNMFQAVAAGSKTPQEAAAEAQKRAERYYKL